MYETWGQVQCNRGKVRSWCLKDGNGGIQEETDVQLFEGSVTFRGAKDLPPCILQKVH